MNYYHLPGFPVLYCLQSLLRFTSIESVMPSNHLILCHPLLLLPSVFPSIRFLMSWLFTSGGRSIGASASVLPMNIQGWFPLGLTGLISLLSKGLSRIFSSATIWRHQFWCSDFFMVQLAHSYMTTGKTIALAIWTFAGERMSLLLNMLSRFVIAFLPRSTHLLTSWWQSLPTVIKPKKIKSATVCPHLSRVYCLLNVWLSAYCSCFGLNHGPSVSSFPRHTHTHTHTHTLTHTHTHILAPQNVTSKMRSLGWSWIQ